MRNRAVRITVSLVLALLAAGALYVTGKTAPRRIKAQSAWVVVKSIQAGEKIPADAVRSALVPSLAPPAALVTGRYAEVGLVPGEVVLANMVTSIPTADLGPGEVAVAVPVQGNAAARARPGDEVDVYWIPPTSDGGPGLAQLILGHARVIGPKGEGPASSGTGWGGVESNGGVVIAVSESDAKGLIGAFGSGQLWLAREA